MRRVWIEIIDCSYAHSDNASPSMRRVWIEIERNKSKIQKALVTLHAEGVD